MAVVNKKKEDSSKKAKETSIKKKNASVKKKTHLFAFNHINPYDFCEIYFPVEKKFKFSWKKATIITSIILVPFLLLALYYFVFFPTITLNGSDKMEVVYPNVYEEPGVKLSRLGKEIKGNVKIDGNVDSTKIGNYKVTYTYKEAFLERTITRRVSIVDKDLPTLTLMGSKELKICPNKVYEEEGYVAQDNYDGDLTANVVKEEKDGEIIYTVKDSSGNETKDIRAIEYLDDTLPEISLTGANPLYVTVGSSYNEPGYSASDNCDGDLTSNVSVEGSVNASTIGTYVLTYSVTDSSNNVTKVERKVIVYKPEPNTGVIYLTFDDGPHATNTAKILDALKRQGVKATFFVTMSGPDNMILREYQEGHTVALHTASHDYKTVYSSVEGYFNDLNQVSERVKRITGQTSYIIRFPGGSSNTVSRHYSQGIMTTLTREVENRGYRYYDWNVSSGDAGDTTSSDGVYSNVVNGLRKNRANVVLMHDIKSFTADAVERIIIYGKNNGYTFLPITMSTPTVHQTVNN